MLSVQIKGDFLLQFVSEPSDNSELRLGEIMPVGIEELNIPAFC